VLFFWHHCAGSLAHVTVVDKALGRATGVVTVSKLPVTTLAMNRL